jgi:hypothetical protein
MRILRGAFVNVVKHEVGRIVLVSRRYAGRVPRDGLLGAHQPFISFIDRRDGGRDDGGLVARGAVGCSHGRRRSGESEGRKERGEELHFRSCLGKLRVVEKELEGEEELRWDGGVKIRAQCSRLLRGGR